MVLLTIILMKVVYGQTKFISRALILIKNAMEFILVHEVLQIEIGRDPELTAIVLV
jgi:tRNA G37 N-methylase Trm5